MALLPAGAFIATFSYKKLLDSYGENKVLRMMDLLGALAIALQLISLHTAVLSLSRFLMGFYCGITSGVVPSFIMSLAPRFTSGIVGTFNQMAVALGMAFAYYMGQLLDDNSFSEITAVRLLIGFPLICLLVHLVVLFLHPYDNV
jgi:MFS transporter, SP family, solute carrier family 2 (facilitated glucose transporter), member 1